MHTFESLLSLFIASRMQSISATTRASLKSLGEEKKRG